MTPKPKPGLIWYEDSEMKRIHRELVKAGMEQAHRPTTGERAA